MLDKFDLAESTGKVRDTKNLGLVLTAEERICVLVVMHHGALDFQEDQGTVLIPIKQKELLEWWSIFIHLRVWSLSVERSKLEELDFEVMRMNSLGSLLVIMDCCCCCFFY